MNASICPLIITTAWIIVQGISWFWANSQGLSKPALKSWGKYLLVFAQSSVLFLAYFFRQQALAPIVVIGLGIMLVGWAYSYQRLIRPNRWALENSKRNPLSPKWAVESFYRILGPSQPSKETWLFGDWLQLLGFGILMNSLLSILSAICALALFEWVAPKIITRELLSAKTEIAFHNRIRRFVWPGWNSLVRIIWIVGVPSLITAVALRDIVLFSEVNQAARSLLLTLLQTELTLGAILFALVVLIIEVTVSSYTPRLVNLLIERRSFKTMLVVVIFSVIFKVVLLANFTIIVQEIGTGDQSLILDSALLLTASTILSYIHFANDAFILFSPEVLANEILKGLDQKWLETVRDEWGTSLGPRTFWTHRDPLVKMERFLIALLNEEDVTSFYTGLYLLTERIQRLQKAGDGHVIDLYLNDRLDSVIKKAAQLNMDQQVKRINIFTEELSNPSAETLENMDLRAYDAPPGTNVCRKVLFYSIRFELPSAGHSALKTIQKRANVFFGLLPSPSKSYQFISPEENDEIDEEEKELRKKNDGLIKTFEEGYIKYLGDSAEEAIKAGMPELSSHASRVHVGLLGELIGKLTEDNSFIYLIRWALFVQRSIVRTACVHALKSAVSIAGRDLRLRSLENEDMALEIGKHFSDLYVRMAKADILDFRTVVDIALAGSDLGWINPEASIEIIRCFGSAGDILHQRHKDQMDENVLFILKEMARRVDSIGDPVRTGQLKDEAQKELKIAKGKISGIIQNEHFD